MKIALFGATGTLGRRILEEALRRGHTVTALSRQPGRLPPRERLKESAVEATDAASVARAVEGHEAVISAIGPAHDGSTPLAMLSDVARALIQGLARARVKRLLIVGGAGSLEVAPGVRLVDTPEFPAAYKALALAHADALPLYQQAAELEWTYVSPAAFIAPGERTGRYRRGGDQLLVGADGQSHISAEDYAIALLDELEQPRAVRRRITVAY